MSRFYDALREASRNPAVPPPADEWVPEPNQAEPASEPAALFDRLSATPAPQAAPEPIRQRNTAAMPTAVPTPVPEPSVTPEDLLDLAFQRPNRPATTEETPGNKTPIVFDAQARLLPHSNDSIVLEHYRRLRTKILQQHEIKPFRTVVVVSAVPQEGKTVTTINLGLSFAMLPAFKVLVIDGDLRRGTIAKWLNVPPKRAGFSDLIEGTADIEDVILSTDQTPARFMVAGNSTISPAELLHSPRLGSILRRLGEHFDLILIDSAPLSLVADAQTLAAQCDAVILATRAFQTSTKSLEHVAKELDGFRIIGAVLNGGTPVKRYRYGGYYGNAND
jgi:capsular exopolysaccharide synthesis family protein